MFSTTPDPKQKHDHVVHPAAESRADQNPKRAWKKSKLRRQHRPYERARPGDRRKMMAENHPTIYPEQEILSIRPRDRRRGALVVQDEDFRRQPFAVEAIADRDAQSPQ